MDSVTLLAQEALLLTVTISLPVVAVAALVSLLMAVLSAMTQVHDATLAHLPRLLAVALVLALTAPWMGSQMVAFASRAFGG
jgi:flagellar biosynthesis protein FliQ